MMTSTYAEIKTLYAKEIAPHIAPLQKKMKWFFCLQIVMLIVAPILAIIFIFQLTLFLLVIVGLTMPGFSKIAGILNNQPWILLVPAIVGAFFVLKQSVKNFKQGQFTFSNSIIDYLFEKFFNNSYQALVIEPLLKHLNPALKLDVVGEFPQEVYNLSKLFTIRPDKYCSTELITDSHQAKFSLGFVHSEYVTRDSDGDTSTSTIFIGLMACIPCPKAMIGKTFVFTDDEEKKWGAVAKQLQGMTDHAGAKLVTMDNPDFEKAFQVYTTDSVQAHYLLSTKWLEKLTDFQRELKIPISIALHSGMCYVALHGYESPFTPQQDFEKALTASGVYSQYIRLKKLFDQLEVLQQIGSTFNDG